MRIDGMALQPAQRLLPTQIGERFQHLALQTFQQLQRDVQKITRPARRVQNTRAA